MKSLKERKSWPPKRPGWKTIERPILGEVAAGKVIDFIPRDQSASIAVPTATKEENVGVVIARGNSLTGDGIQDGDLLLFKKNFTKREAIFNICIVFVIPTGELIAKKVAFGESGTITLKSSGGNVKDKTYSAEDIEIRGVVFSFQRMLRK